MRSFFMDFSPYSKTEYFFITKQIKKHTLQKNSKNSTADKKHLSIFYKPKEIYKKFYKVNNNLQKYGIISLGINILFLAIQS